MNAYRARFSGGQIDLSQPRGSRTNPYLARDDSTLSRFAANPRNRGQYIITPNGDLAVIE